MGEWDDGATSELFGSTNLVPSVARTAFDFAALSRVLGGIGAGLSIVATLSNIGDQRRQLRLERDLAAISIEELEFTQDHLVDSARAGYADFALSREDLQQKYDFGNQQLTAQGDLLRLGELQADTQLAFEGKQLGTALQLTSERARIESANLGFARSALGKSAFFRAGTSVALAGTAQAQDQLIIARNLGVLSQEQFAIGRRQISEQQTFFDEQYALNTEKISKAEEDFIRQYEYEYGRTEFARRRLERERRASGGFYDEAFEIGRLNRTPNRTAEQQQRLDDLVERRRRREAGQNTEAPDITQPQAPEQA
jgi:hypothetical protein